LGEVASEGQLFTHQLAPTVRLLFDLPQKQEKGFGLPMLLNE
jgi:hypothetical protein